MMPIANANHSRAGDTRIGGVAAARITPSPLAVVGTFVGRRNDRSKQWLRLSSTLNPLDNGGENDDRVFELGIGRSTRSIASLPDRGGLATATRS